MSGKGKSELDKYLPRFGGKALINKDTAKQLGTWLAQQGLVGLVVFGVDVLYALGRHGEMHSIPIHFNHFVWTMASINAILAAYRAARLARKRSRRETAELTVHFSGGVKPGDEGFDVPAEWAEELPMPTNAEVGSEAKEE